MKCNPETLCETNFEATVTLFEFSSEFSGNPAAGSGGRGLETFSFNRETCRLRGVQGKSGRQSWSQAKDGRSCGGPTGEFAPVKVENEFADGKIC